MVRDLSADEIYLFITTDFRGAWDSMAANSATIGRGNLMFGRQAMSLLEFAAKLCTNDTSGIALKSLSSQLLSIEPKYFTKLPGPCAVSKEFTLPHDGDTSRKLLLWVLFDLIRSGLAHQYQQILVKLNDAKDFYIKLTGNKAGLDLVTVQSRPRPIDHLAYSFDVDDDIELTVKPDILFIDFDNAINKSGLLKMGLSFPAMSKPTTKSVNYNFDITSLENSLTTAGHNKI
jgi:hypothetical protein